MSAKVFYEKDCDLKALKGKTICVLGYGSQGRAHAQNLKDSGLTVVVALREGSRSFARCQADGLTALPMAQAVKGADLYAFLLPDPGQPEVYRRFVAPELTPGKGLLFAHGFNVHFGQIVPPPEVDVFMVAPKGPGRLVRQLFEHGQGVPCLLAVEQDPSGTAQAQGLAYALALGGARAGVIATSFREETETDLFGEQAVLCGGVTALMKTGFEVLVEAGYSPEMAYFECINEMKLIIDLIYEGRPGSHAQERQRHRQVRRPHPRPPHRGRAASARPCGRSWRRSRAASSPGNGCWRTRPTGRSTTPCSGARPNTRWRRWAAGCAA